MQTHSSISQVNICNSRLQFHGCDTNEAWATQPLHTLAFKLTRRQALPLTLGSSVAYFSFIPFLLQRCNLSSQMNMQSFAFKRTKLHLKSFFNCQLFLSIPRPKVVNLYAREPHHCVDEEIGLLYEYIKGALSSIHLPTLQHLTFSWHGLYHYTISDPYTILYCKSLAPDLIPTHLLYIYKSCNDLS